MAHVARCPSCGTTKPAEAITAVTVTEAAELRRVSDQTIRNWIAAGRLPNAWREEHVPGRFRWWIPVADLDTLEAA